LVPGIYESLLTERLKAILDGLDAEDLLATVLDVDKAEQAAILADHVGAVLGRVLTAAPADDRVAITNRVLKAVLVEASKQAEVIETVEPGPRQLAEVRRQSLSSMPLQRPRIPLRDADLLINARGEPGLVAELQTEIASADRIDLLCAFIKWHGIRLLWDDLEQFVVGGKPLRIITTTYVGATESRAVDALARLGADIKISYETRSTRLHAKAWLFHRDSGWDTAYVGSSNLSRSALVDGLEWNVRLSRGATSALIDKFAATFSSYWEEGHFEPFDPDRDRERLDEALGRAHRQEPLSLSGLEVRPFPYQETILDDLDRERHRHDRWRNLVVAATGTGKTVVAALDYQRLCAEFGGRPRLLFVAHRKEILEQSLRTFREVLVDQDLGELYVDGHSPEEWDHVFASIQSLHRVDLDRLDPARFAVVIVDEFHHAEAATYTRLLQHLEPRVLLGLTATPFRADGQDITHWFDGHIASELSLWQALERDLLCPFHYFGIADGTDLSGIQWKRGGYDLVGLDSLYTGNDTRAAVVLREVRDKITEPVEMRALGFCVSVAHAHYMARVFTEAGIPAAAVDAATDRRQRNDVLRQLREREVNTVFAVDLFNEGVDVPAVDTVLMLRPTESATIFLQQLGRGLRRAPGKDCLTVLDFIGQQHRRFRFDSRYLAITGGRRSGLADQIEEGFPFLPPGTHIHLTKQAQEIVLENVRSQVKPTRPQLAAELRAVGDVSLGEYLDCSERTVAELYRGRSSWTALRRSAGLATEATGPDDDKLLRQLLRLTHADDPERLAFLREFVSSVTPPRMDTLSVREQRLARMLFFTLWRNGGGFDGYDAGFTYLWKHPAVLAEIVSLTGVLDEAAEFTPRPLSSHFADVPLWTHCRYSTEEILAATGHATLERVPSSDMAGVRYVPDLETDVLTFTLQKSEREYSPTTLYRDYAISSELIHWESQSTTSLASPTGQRYLNQRRNGTHVLLFARETKNAEHGSAAAFLCLGEADYVSGKGERPIAITWRLRTSLPGAFFASAAIAAV
jgi:superfamily II DNA or RNA helicase/HKD family nuclease